MASEFDTWIMTIEVYLAVHAAKFTNDKVHSLAILSCMKGGIAGPWANKIIQEKIDKLAADWFSWKELKTQLEAVFKDHTAKQKARDKLEYLCQGEKHSINSFFAPFETLASECKVTDDKQLIYPLDRTVKTKYIDQIITTPTEYKKYQELILHITHYHEQQEEQLCFKQCHTHFFTEPVKATDKPPSELPQQDKQTGTGVVAKRWMSMPHDNRIVVSIAERLVTSSMTVLTRQRRSLMLECWRWI